MVSPNKLKVKKQIEFKQIFGPKTWINKFGLKIILSRKNFGSKNCGSKKSLIQKI